MATRKRANAYSVEEVLEMMEDDDVMSADEFDGVEDVTVEGVTAEGVTALKALPSKALLLLAGMEYQSMSMTLDAQKI